MHHFRRLAGRLTAEGHDLEELARRWGTPLYVYSAATMRDGFRRLVAALAPLDATVCYAVKANSHLAVLRTFAAEGAGFDLVSGGEIRRALAAGADPGRCVFAGVGKTGAEIALGLEAGVLGFHVESEPELERINAVAGRLGRRAPVAIRVNPDVDAGTHAKITTGRSENKFGIPLATAQAVFERAARLPHVELRGIQMHIGSQITEVNPFVAAVTRVAGFLSETSGRFPFRYFSIGGGLGIPYRDALASGDAEWWRAAGRPLTPEAYGAALVPLLQPLGLRILLEPGRFLVGNAGVLLSKVEYVKRGAGRVFIIADAGMNDLMRPAMYEAYHEIVPVVSRGRAPLVADVVGPVCESGDCFAKDREIEAPEAGEVLAFLSAGAYGAAMASRYNTRSLPAEVLVDGERAALVTRREDFAGLVANESIPAWLAAGEARA